MTNGPGDAVDNRLVEWMSTEVNRKLKGCARLSEFSGYRKSFQ